MPDDSPAINCVADYLKGSGYDTANVFAEKVIPDEFVRLLPCLPEKFFFGNRIQKSAARPRFFYGASHLVDCINIYSGFNLNVYDKQPHPHPNPPLEGKGISGVAQTYTTKRKTLSLED
ncbi:MAG: hypothetical protein LBP90_04425 [Burkholderiales bacterium]|nr:hypothetical protein [Burkholderiales bacterium]